MTMYSNVADVAAELGGVTINTTSTPTVTIVNGWIQDASDEIDRVTKRIWSKDTVTSSAYEYMDHDGSNIIKLKHKPVISVESLEYESEGLGAATTAWSSCTEGRTDASEFVLYKDEGVIKFHTNSDGKWPIYGHQNIRVTYTYGYESTPRSVKRLCALLVAKRYILSVANKAGTEEPGGMSVGTISASDPNSYMQNHLRFINDEIDRLWKNVVPKFKTFEINTNLYD